MRFKIITSCLLMLLFIQCKAQSFIDLSKDEVKLIIKEEHKKMSPDKSIVKQQFNYLKFVKRGGDETLIVYFTKKDICKTSKFIYDYSILDEVVEKLNTQHEKVGECKWECDGNEITLTKQEWYFTVRERKQ